MSFCIGFYKKIDFIHPLIKKNTFLKRHRLSHENQLFHLEPSEVCFEGICVLAQALCPSPGLVS